MAKSWWLLSAAVSYQKMSPDPADKRKSPRANSLKVVVRIPSVDRFRTHYLKDISEGGLFVKAEKVLPEGALLSLELWPPGWDEAVELSAKVIRSTDAATAALEGKPCGMAVQFVSVPVEVDRQLKSLVEAYQGEEAEAPVDPVGAQIEAMIAELAETRAKVSQLETQLAEARGSAEAFSEEVHKLHREEAEARANSVKLAQERTELERKLKDTTAKAAAEDAAHKQLLEAARVAKEQVSRELAQQREEGRAILAQVTLDRNDLERRLKELTAKAAESEMGLRDQIDAARGDMAQQREETRQQRERADRFAAELKEREGREQGLKRLLNRATPSRKAAAEPDTRADDVVVISDTGEWNAVTATEKAVPEKPAPPPPPPPTKPAPTKPAPAQASPSEVDLEIDLGELDLGEEIDLSFASAAAPSPMLSSMAEGEEVPQGFAKFNASLKIKTRLVAPLGLGGQKPVGPEEIRICQLLEASPTFGTMVNQLDGMIEEERIRRVLFDLLGKKLVEVRE
jgi:uncharacterized protein (TIGR02266 family)